MTNKIKTVQKPKLIFAACKGSEHIAELISDILDFCSYNTCIDEYSANTDFVIADYAFGDNLPEGVISETVIFDGTADINDEFLSKFRIKVASYESCCERFGDRTDGILTYSTENYDADVTCRNLEGGGSFDIIVNGILSRVDIGEKYSAEDALICTSVLLATGIPLASIVEYFTA